MQFLAINILLNKADVNITVSVEMNSAKNYTEQWQWIINVNSPITALHKCQKEN